uniref:FMRFamide-4 n=2 Tax=Calyptratae TaxID=43742 RepID=FAR4_LUCCU|nr:RecName: Full=FMRFamide-like neuropeptide GGNDFMRF-amide [Delia radicum]P85451.1 RecName: Full=FMRFamide-4; AltName: Full=LucFMRFamide-4 [Lucilia cuprina]
GGNDFMRF